MADSLMDVIKKRIAAPTGPQDLGLGNAAQSQQILGTKSGKAVGPSSGPAASSLAEQQTAATNQQALNQTQQEGSIKAQQLGAQSTDQQQSADIQQQQLATKTQAFKTQNQNQINALLQDRDQANATLDLSKRQAIDDQIGFNERLSNDKYVNDLTNAGAQARLDDNASFQQQLQQNYYAGMEDLLDKDTNFKQLVDASGRDFDKKLASMDTDMAMAILQKNIQAQNISNQYAGAGTVVSAGLGYAGSQASNPSTPATPSASPSAPAPGSSFGPTVAGAEPPP